MTLKEAFEKEKFSGKVVCILHDGYEYKVECDDGWLWLYSECFGSGMLPENFLPYADNEVLSIEDSWRSEGGKEIRVLAHPADDYCEIFGTGGGFVNGVCKVDDGWFMGEVNGLGGVWKNCTVAIESYPEEENGFVRSVETFDELKAIRTKCYTTIINSPSANKWEKRDAEEYLKTLDKELKKAINVMIYGIYEDEDDD